jgi:hypothetical protein
MMRGMAKRKSSRKPVPCLCGLEHYCPNHDAWDGHHGAKQIGEYMADRLSKARAEIRRLRRIVRGVARIVTRSAANPDWEVSS